MNMRQKVRAEASTSLSAVAAHAAPITSTPPGPARPQDVCLYRLPQVLARIPVAKSTWFAGIKAGRFPKGRSIGPRTTVWRSDEIDQIVLGVTR